MQPHIAGARREPRPHVAIDHRLHLAGRARHQRDHRIAMLDPQPGRGAVRVREHDGAARHLCLAPIVHRHLPAPRRKALLHRLDDRRILIERQVEMRRHHFPREVIVGGTEAAGQDQHAVPRQRVRDVRGQLVAVVADDGLERDRDPKVVEDLRDVERVGVGLLRREQFAAHGDDCRVEPGARAHAANQAGAIITPMRNTRCAYTPAIASSAMMPSPEGRCSRRPAGNGLITSNTRNNRKPSDDAPRRERQEGQRDQHAEHFVDHDRTRIFPGQRTLSAGGGPDADQQTPRRS